MLIKGCGSFTDSLWRQAAPVFNKIISHPFNRQLSEGTLPEKVFREYLQQDILYLAEDTKALSITAERAPEGDEKDFFKKLVTVGIELEKSLHKDLAENFGISESSCMNRSCREYCFFLLDSAVSGTYPEAVAALLPCYWIYQNAGLVTASAAADDNRYKAWLDTYSGEEFTAFTRQYIKIAERIAEKSDSLISTEMSDSFMAAAVYELKFLESLDI